MSPSKHLPGDHLSGWLNDGGGLVGIMNMALIGWISA